MNRTLLWIVGAVVVIGGLYLLFVYRGAAPVPQDTIGGDGGVVATTTTPAPTPTPAPAPGQGIVPYHSGVAGKVLLGPTCPVMRNPPDPACAEKGYQTTVRIFRSNSAALYATAKSAVDGSFTFSLPPGGYRLEADGGSPMPRCAPVDVTVGPVYVTQDISCDTGIR